MRKKIVTAVAGVALGASGMLLAGPALAAAGTPGAAAVSSRVDRVKQALSGLVTDRTLTRAQADRVATTLGKIDLGGRGGRGPGGGPDRGADLDAAAEALGMTAADLRTALQGGKTLAGVAGDRGVPVATLVAALVDTEETELAQAVEDGRITQAQADQRSADLTARITDRVHAIRPDRGPGGRGTGGIGPQQAPGG